MPEEYPATCEMSTWQSAVRHHKSATTLYPLVKTDTTRSMHATTTHLQYKFLTDSPPNPFTITSTKEAPLMCCQQQTTKNIVGGYIQKRRGLQGWYLAFGSSLSIIFVFQWNFADMQKGGREDWRVVVMTHVLESHRGRMRSSSNSVCDLTSKEIPKKCLVSFIVPVKQYA